jgi:hypothetical protein
LYQKYGITSKAVGRADSGDFLTPDDGDGSKQMSLRVHSGLKLAKSTKPTETAGQRKANCEPKVRFLFAGCESKE